MARGYALAMAASPIAMTPTTPRCSALRRTGTAAAAAAAGGGGAAAGGAGGVFRDDEEVRSGGVMPRASVSSSLAPIEAIEEIPGTSYRSSSSSNGKNSRRDARSRLVKTERGRGGSQARRGSTVKKLKIAIDIDDVLAAYLPVVNAYYNERFSTSFTTSDYFVYDYKQVWGCSQQESNERVHEFYGSHAFLNTVQPIPGAVASISRLREHHDLVVVTSRQLAIEEPTRAWIQRHFPPGTFLSINFGNAYALTGPQRSKAEICLEHGCHVLIDDNPKYAQECADEGIDTLLFDYNLQYAWSKSLPGQRSEEEEEEVTEHDDSSGIPKGDCGTRITRVADWDEVEAWIWEACTSESPSAGRDDTKDNSGANYRRIMG